MKSNLWYEANQNYKKSKMSSSNQPFSRNKEVIDFYEMLILESSRNGLGYIDIYSSKIPKIINVYKGKRKLAIKDLHGYFKKQGFKVVLIEGLFINQLYVEWEN